MRARSSSELSLTAFEFKIAAYTVKTHADVILFLTGLDSQKSWRCRGDKGLLSVGSDPETRSAAEDEMELLLPLQSAGRRFITEDDFFFFFFCDCFTTSSLSDLSCCVREF